jgi:hypothetical protein
MFGQTATARAGLPVHEYERVRDDFGELRAARAWNCLARPVLKLDLEDDPAWAVGDPPVVDSCRYAGIESDVGGKDLLRIRGSLDREFA